jgi:hypothetical protein
MKLITQAISKEEIQNLVKEYGNYLKLTVDLERGWIMAGGELHADGEKILLEKESKQENIWGGGIDFETKLIDTTAILNYRPNLDNNSLEIQDNHRREKFISVVKMIFKKLWA